MPQIARIIGGAGTAKTTELLRLMDLALEHYRDPRLIGFVSFTRAARKEAASRAAIQYNIRPWELQDRGWFKTIHAVCYHCLGVKQELITGSVEDCKWLTEILDESISAVNSNSLDDDQISSPFLDKASSADKALHAWNMARNRLVSLQEAHDELNVVDQTMPGYDYCTAIVERYETAKRVHGRLDFTDMLARFAGWFMTVDGPQKTEPDGIPPDLPVWIVDEAQDITPLAHAVCQRVIHSPSCRWCYVAGDWAQLIYSFGGASPACFRDGWPSAKTRTLPKSFRCAPQIFELGERILSECSDYYDRGIQPADHEGYVERARLAELASMVDPREDWLILARTNLLAQQAANMLEKAGIPWVSLKGSGVWQAPVRNAAIRAMLALEENSPIDGHDWANILKYIPTRSDSGRLLEQGTKKRFEEMDHPEQQYGFVLLDGLAELGATPALVEAIHQHEWRRWITGADRYIGACKQWGEEAVMKPKIRIGTIHGSKGMEADHVGVLTSIPLTCYHGAQTPSGFDEEQRVFHVAVTRARRRLTLFDEHRARFRKKIPY